MVMVFWSSRYEAGLVGKGLGGLGAVKDRLIVRRTRYWNRI